MTVFLVSLVAFLAVLAVVGVLWLLNKNLERTADERAYLLNVIVAKHGTELRSMVIPPQGPAISQETRWQDDLEGFEAQVGL